MRTERIACCFPPNHRQAGRYWGRIEVCSACKSSADHTDGIFRTRGAPSSKAAWCGRLFQHQPVEAVGPKREKGGRVRDAGESAAAEKLLGLIALIGGEIDLKGLRESGKGWPQ